MEKEFTFETDYDISALSAMARALRKTVRKKQSRRSRIFGWTVAVLGILTTAALGINVVTLTAIVILVLFLLFEDRMNGYMAKKRVRSIADVSFIRTNSCRSRRLERPNSVTTGSNMWRRIRDTFCSY